MLNLKPAPFPVLTTDRLVLRQLLLTDAPRIHQLRSDPEINRYVDRPPSKSVDDAIAFIHKIDDTIVNGKGLYWVITLNGDDSAIGTLCFWNFDDDDRSIEVGYELMTGYQGKGIMAEALKAVVNYGFGQMNAKTVTAFLAADNEASINVLNKLGFIADASLLTDQDSADGMLAYKLSRS